MDVKLKITESIQSIIHVSRLQLGPERQRKKTVKLHSEHKDADNEDLWELERGLASEDEEASGDQEASEDQEASGAPEASGVQELITDKTKKASEFHLTPPYTPAVRREDPEQEHEENIPCVQSQVANSQGEVQVGGPRAIDQEEVQVPMAKGSVINNSVINNSVINGPVINNSVINNSVINNPTMLRDQR